MPPPLFCRAACASWPALHKVSAVSSSSGLRSDLLGSLSEDLLQKIKDELPCTEYFALKQTNRMHANAVYKTNSCEIQKEFAIITVVA